MQIIRVRLINAKGRTIGCEKAPVEILNALKEIGCNEKGKLIEFAKLNLEEIHVDLNNLEEANHLIYENSKEIFEKNFKAFFLGGDHCISYSIVKAFNKVEKNPLLIIFDAHADCLEPTKVPTHENWLSKLIEEDGFNTRNVILISTRDLWEKEIEFLNENEINLIKMDVLREDLDGICDLVMERARNSSGFYVSLDIDCLDPAFAPATGYLEPGGLSSRDLIHFVKRLVLLDNFRGADIVEINPDKDVNGMTVKMGAKLLAEMI
ncbi:arginase family protein [Candidatus Pacearchaeota archaeon]|nr:arginase family protein [Candidatus Pacearchaeota archaeon]